MPPSGFSTGALALADFERGMMLNAQAGATAIELSALRDRELPRLLEALPGLDLSRYSYVSIHAPSRFEQYSESQIVEWLCAIPGDFPTIVHPDSIADVQLWRKLGGRVCIENMDSRKSFGSTVEDLREIFSALPQAGFCLDLAHAQKVDMRLLNARQMLKEFGPRLREIHISQLNAQFGHRPLSDSTAKEFKQLLAIAEVGVPLIIESLVDEQDILQELNLVRWIGEYSGDRQVAL